MYRACCSDTKNIQDALGQKFGNYCKWREHDAWRDAWRMKHDACRMKHDMTRHAMYTCIHVVHHLSTFFGGLVVGFIYGWQLALLILGMTPLLAVAGGAFVSR